jgi:protein-disulfide isomerase
MPTNYKNMSFIKRNIWAVGFAVIFIGALAAMYFARNASTIPSPTGTAKDEVEFVITEKDHVKGAENAKVTIVEFSDFQCPACRAYYPVVDDLLEKFPNDVRLVYKYFPLTQIHFRALASSYAAEAAGLQGKFWEMHPLLFDNQDVWSRQNDTKEFERYAVQMGLDLAKFKSDMESDAVKERVQSELKYAVDLGANSTPTFYVNGKKISNPKSLEDFEAIIRNELGQTTP